MNNFRPLLYWQSSSTTEGSFNSLSLLRSFFLNKAEWRNSYNSIIIRSLNKIYWTITCDVKVWLHNNITPLQIERKSLCDKKIIVDLHNYFVTKSVIPLITKDKYNLSYLHAKLFYFFFKSVQMSARVNIWSGLEW